MDAGFSKEFCERFAGTARLFGAEAFEKIARSRVCLVGLGGVGSWACEALARSGICSLTLVDMDAVCPTNTNRQLPALDGNFGRAKAEVLAERVRAINPACEVAVHKIFITRETAPDFFAGTPPFPRERFDAVADAIDGAANKAALIAACHAAGTPVFSSGGCAGKCDGTRVEFADLADAENDSLLKFVRRELRSRYGFPKGDSGEKMGVPVVFSREQARPSAVFSTEKQSAKMAFPQMISPAGGKPRAGTAAFVTGAFGLALAQRIVGFLARRKI